MASKCILVTDGELTVTRKTPLCLDLSFAKCTALPGTGTARHWFGFLHEDTNWTNFCVSFKTLLQITIILNLAIKIRGVI